MTNLVNCPVCNSHNINYKDLFFDPHYGNEGVFRYDQCKECNLVFQNPMRSDQELMSYYPSDDYYAYSAKFNVEKKKITSNGKKILDIGCGNGWVLNEFKNNGWEVFGIEPSKKAADIGNDLGLNIFNGTVLECDFSNNFFDYIHSNHSFEHIYNPNEVLEKLHNILKIGGKIQIGVPNYNSFNAKLFGKYWYYFGAPVHTFNYSPNNLIDLMKRYGFKNFELKHVSTGLGILGSIQILVNKNKKIKSEGFLLKSLWANRIAYGISILLNTLRLGDCIEVVAYK